MNNTNPATPISFDIAQVPTDFGSGRLKDLLVTFDNLNRELPLSTAINHFPIKCNSFFTVAVLKGYIRLIINLREVEVQAGEMLIMTPGCIFENQEASSDVSFCGLLLDNEFSDIMRKNIGLHAELTRRYYNFDVRHLTETAMQHHIRMYNMVCQELQQDDYFYKTDVVQRLCEIWFLKLRSESSTFGQELEELNRPMNRKEQIFHDFLALLEKYFRRERSISFYASQMCLTPKYMSSIIREISGKHGTQWIDDYVALEAKALLRNSDLTIKQIADTLNFPSQSMFGRFFKKMTGYSPKQYKLL